MGQDIRLTASDGHELGAYKAAPSGAPKGGVVVVQEIFGVNSHIRSVCDSYAAAGYLAIAPAIFDRIERDVQIGYTPDEVARGRELRGRSDTDAAIMDIAAAAEAAAEATAGGGKVGIVGYCWGGQLVYIASCRLGDKLAAGSGYYGGGIKAFIDETPAIPLILHFGTLDASIPADEVDLIRETHPKVTVYTYEGAGHGFNCDQRAQYHPEAAKLAGERTLAFFGEQLS